MVSLLNNALSNINKFYIILTLNLLIVIFKNKCTQEHYTHYYYGAAVLDGRRRWRSVEGGRGDSDPDGKVHPRSGKAVTKSSNEGKLGWWTMKARRYLLRLRYWAKLDRMPKRRLTKQVYLARRKKLQIQRDTDDKTNWCYHTRELLRELKLGQKWRSQEVPDNKE